MKTQAVEAGQYSWQNLFLGGACYLESLCRMAKPALSCSAVVGDKVDHLVQKYLLNNCQEDEATWKKQLLAIVSLCWDDNQCNNEN